MDAIRHAIRKGEILRHLRVKYPEVMDFFLLRHSMATSAMPLLEKELIEYLHYLAEEKYVTLREDKDNYILCARLTAKGLKLLDGWIEDPAVMVK